MAASAEFPLTTSTAGENQNLFGQNRATNRRSTSCLAYFSNTFGNYGERRKGKPPLNCPWKRQSIHHRNLRIPSSGTKLWQLDIPRRHKEVNLQLTPSPATNLLKHLLEQRTSPGKEIHLNLLRPLNMSS